MTTTNLSLILTQTTITSGGKKTKTSRRFSQLNPNASNESLIRFAKAIEILTGEQYDSIEVVKTELIG
ncbi:DUF1659 domain-containing protein [Staphylococcus felis]|uniref:DUF1659 domain-containing protein n=1 Tax=Staphylococcus felis TaxID=46127 RepID=A0AAX1RSS2_9STAP|nr:DUF1659 domain-containing protein [Staphylococcus felis]AVP35729.1 DUF1659 domain-containing protein [Staphylococcus felis]MBH9580846.1 DUF1659 domain-containing protein [Staphylococcus felis]MDM8327390.1 DUF1659 domain-containing protein [Staphylococcus felis]MDQ7192388.1 DUF1659 domain-containing protein [Staphylococcus felis]PNZ36834.1 DUF1659 domain-containing protein [Staphylococcus felis]